MEQNNFTRTELNDLIKELFGLDEIPHIFLSQIDRFIIERKLSCYDIACVLCYWEQMNQIEKDRNKLVKYGIWNVPDYVKQAKGYIRQTKELKESQLRALATQQIKEIKIKVPKAEKPRSGRKHIDIEKMINGGE